MPRWTAWPTPPSDSRRSTGDSWPTPASAFGLLLANRAAGRPEGLRLIPEFLADRDDDVRFLAAKWVADQKLTEFRPLVVEALKDRDLNIRLYTALATALARVDGQDVSEAKLADFFFDRLADDKAPPGIRVKALQLLPTSNAKLTVDLLSGLVKLTGDPALQLEAARRSPSTAGLVPLAIYSKGPATASCRRTSGPSWSSAWRTIPRRGGPTCSRSPATTTRPCVTRPCAPLVDTPLEAAGRESLAAVAESHPESADLVHRVLGKPFVNDRPPPADLAAWLKRLDGPADAKAGRRVFFEPKLAACDRCHRVDGRGGNVGPDLSTIGRTDRRRSSSRFSNRAARSARATRPGSSPRPTAGCSPGCSSTPTWTSTRTSIRPESPSCSARPTSRSGRR